MKELILASEVSKNDLVLTKIATWGEKTIKKDLQGKNATLINVHVGLT